MSNTSSTLSKVGLTIAGLGSTLTPALKTYGDVLNAKSYINRGYSLMLRPQSLNDSYDNLRRDYASWSRLNGVSLKDIGYSDTNAFMNILNSTGNGAAAGSTFGGFGTLGGAIFGLGAGLIGAITAKKKAKEQATKINDVYNDINSYNLRMFNTRYQNLRNDEEESLTSNAYFNRGLGYANGGIISSLNDGILSPFGNRFYGGGPIEKLMHSNGTDWNNGFTYIGAGGSHEENSLGGTPVSLDPQGALNLTEEGEVLYDSPAVGGTMAYSQRLNIPDEDRDFLGLPKGGFLAYAGGMLKAQKRVAEMPNDPIEKRGMDIFAKRMAASQERTKQRRNQFKLAIEDLVNQNIATTFAACGGRLSVGKKFDDGGNVDVDRRLAQQRWREAQTHLKRTPEWASMDNIEPNDNENLRQLAVQNGLYLMNKMDAANRSLARKYNAEIIRYNKLNEALDAEKINNIEQLRSNYWLLGEHMNEFGLGGLMGNIFKDAGSIPTKLTGELAKYNEIIDEMTPELLQGIIDTQSLGEIGIKDKATLIEAIQDVEKSGVVKKALDEIGLNTVLVPGNAKWTNLGKSTRTYKDNEPTPYKWEKNNLVHKDVREHLKNNYILSGTPEQREAWINRTREDAIAKYKKEHPEDKGLKNFIDPTENIVFNELPYDIPNGNVSYLYEPSNLTEELLKEYKDLYKNNLWINSSVINGIYTDPDTGAVIPNEYITDENKDEYQWRPASALDIVEDPVTGELHYDTAIGESILNKYNYDWNTTTLHKPEEPAEMPGYGLSGLRFAPLGVSLASVMGDIFGATNVATKESGNMLRNSIPMLDVPAYHEALDYISTKPFAEDYYINLYLKLARANERGILGSVGGNRAAAAQQLLTANLNTLDKIGDLGRAALEYNRNDYLKVRDYNRKSKEMDLDNAYKYALLGLDSSKAKQDILAKSIAMDDAELAAVSLNRASNMDKFAENMGALGEDAWNYRMFLMLKNAGVFGTTLDLARRNYDRDMLAYNDWEVNKRNNNLNFPSIKIPAANGGKLSKKRRKNTLTY